MGQAMRRKPATHRPIVLTSIVIGMFMAAIEATIVATAMPNIVADLGGFSLYSWVFSIFLLMQAITVPIYGKLADLYGRKPVYVTGVIIFLIASILCGIANSMPFLILFRFLQGIGAGAVQPIAMTIVGDIYTIEERSKIQGYLASVWGISAIIGPTLGGFFVEFLHWKWIFWINIPFGVLSLAGIIFFLDERIETKKRSIDYLGAAFLFISVTGLMIAFIQGGVAWSWLSTESLLFLSLFLGGFLLFLIQENRATEPIMPLWIWKNQIISIANAASLTTGMIMIGIISFIPTYVQGAMEHSAIVGGFTLAVMSIGWPICSTIAGKILLTIGFRKTALIGGVCLIIGSILLLISQPEYGPVLVGFGSFFIGAGMGFTTTTYIVSIQSNVAWNVRGVATASNMFMRILGNTMGVSIMGALLNMRLLVYLEEHAPSGSSFGLGIADTLLDPIQRDQLPNELAGILQEGLAISIQSIFWFLAILACITFILNMFLPPKTTRTGDD
ncbi:MDR family MFS transporter [Alteribacillus iranensis]|uniref:Drug resistance transporter, EmrB/QacA subfamily n=1 Tax=Alteribacillus iranensis TaxID=930128 RepID=A0A1I2DSJ8_9BACI|nr:MDR family MFS transporter [Alteribacillus iranensis]SFE83602.1 drug resistance transporter, EmrB/QacA subfamily [Alteribacillus iranensis]